MLSQKISTTEFNDHHGEAEINHGRVCHASRQMNRPRCYLPVWMGRVGTGIVSQHGRASRLYVDVDRTAGDGGLCALYWVIRAVLTS